MKLLKSLHQTINHLKSELLIFLFLNCYIFYLSFSIFNQSSKDRLKFKAKFIKSNESNNSFHFDKYSYINKSLHYILFWNPAEMLSEKRNSFTENKCKHTNCYITYDKNYLKDITDYDAILFNGCSVRQWKTKSDLPENRTRRQKYIFTTLESSVLCPVTNPIYDDFFNWTWTFKLDSDIAWKYVHVYNTNGSIIAPAANVKWQTNSKPISEGLKKKLNHKTKALAWFVSHCRTSSRREEFVAELNKESIKYGWTVDEYGGCSGRRCDSVWCYKMLEKKYHFYFSAENSFSEDYVTEKLLVPLQNSAVPVVFGGANYTRFLPPGSYLDARVLGPKKLAEAMTTLMNNKTSYHKLFEWRNNYKYVSGELPDICNLCKALNDEDKMTKESRYQKFRAWWNGASRQALYDFLLKSFLNDKPLMELAAHYNFTRQANKVLWNRIANMPIQPKSSKMLKTGAKHNKRK